MEWGREVRSMKALARSLVVVMVALIAVPALVVTTAVTSAVQLLATTALIMGGTQHSLAPFDDPDYPDDPVYVNEYMAQAVGNYISTQTTAPDNEVAVIYPAEFFPVFGSTTFDDSVDDGVANLGRCLGVSAATCGTNPNFDTPPAPGAGEHFIVFGYSQSAVVASLVKNDLVEHCVEDGGTCGADYDDLNGTEFFLVSNPMRPNGGILAREFEGATIPFIGITFRGPTKNSCAEVECTAADGYQTPTVDVAQQYDLLGGDAPAQLDLLALGNSLASYTELHGDMPSRDLELEADGVTPVDRSIIYQGQYGDTKYYLVTARRLPMLMPLDSVLEQTCGCSYMLNLPDAVLRVLIEASYRRDLSPGEHVKLGSGVPNPGVLVGNMLGAVSVGMDDTVAEMSGDPDNRPNGTKNVYRPFGVGGPVYDKDTGQRVEDNVGTPTGSGDYEGGPPVTESLQTTSNESDSQKVVQKNDGKKADELGNVIPKAPEVPKVTLPDPPKVPGPFRFEPPKLPEGLVPDYDNLLTPIRNVLNKFGPSASPQTPSGTDAGDQAKPEQKNEEAGAA